MKANELMHGDFVSYGRHVCRFVIDAKTAYLQRLSDCTQYLPCACQEAEPIPLTEEILKANGFHKVHHAGTGCTQEYDDYITNGFLCRHMTDDWKDLRFCLPDTPLTFNYVHELQHVLRLCGLNDIADNLKV